MGDWESIFGAGISAESVIANIDASWHAERWGEYKDREARLRKRRRRKVTAYLGSGELRCRFLRRMKLRLAADHLVTTGADASLIRFLYPSVDPFRKLEARYNIPTDLTEILDMIAGGLIDCADSYSPGELLDKNSLPWLIECFDAIRPGVDLRFLAPKFLTGIARFAFASSGGKNDERSTRLRKACDPAIAVLYAKARGVQVQEAVRKAAYEAAKGAVDERWEFNHLDYNDNDCLRAGIIASAIDLLPGSAGTAVRYAVALDCNVRTRGDADEKDYWKDSADDILALIRSAPTERVKIINLDVVSHAIGRTNFTI